MDLLVQVLEVFRDIVVATSRAGGVGLGVKVGRIGLSCHWLVLVLFHELKTNHKVLEECSRVEEDDPLGGRGLGMIL